MKLKLAVILLCCTAFTLPKLPAHKRRLKAPTTHGAMLLMSKPASNQAAAAFPSPSWYLPFKYPPGIATNTRNFTWILQSTTNLNSATNWITEQWNLGWDGSTNVTVTNGHERIKLFRIKGQWIGP